MPLAANHNHGILGMLAAREAIVDIDPQEVPSVMKVIFTGQYLNCFLATLLIYDARESSRIHGRNWI